jgi:hypothetical protein
MRQLYIYIYHILYIMYLICKMIGKWRVREKEKEREEKKHLYECILRICIFAPKAGDKYINIINHY